MRRSAIIILLHTCILLFFGGCDKDENQDKGSYTMRITNPFQVDIKIIGSLCLFQDCELAPGQTSTYEGQILSDADIGVTLFANAKKPNPDMPYGIEQLGSVHFYPEPDGNYAWTAGKNNPVREVSPDDDGGSGAGCSISNYNGPEFDIQIDGQCKAAFIYQCVGNTEGVKAACEIYRNWQKHQPGIPNCPYCN